MKPVFVILDNGHGGILDGVYQTPGKRSPVWPDGSQLFEGEFNRDIVRMLAEKFRGANIAHNILVPELTDVSLTERVRRANSIFKSKRDAFRVVLISVHANAASAEAAKGFEVFTSPGETESDKVAEIYFQECKKVLSSVTKMRPDTSDGDSDKEAKFTIINDTHCPAILTENGFMTNYDECKLLMSPEFRETIAEIHFNTVKTYNSSI